MAPKPDPAKEDKAFFDGIMLRRVSVWFAPTVRGPGKRGTWYAGTVDAVEPPKFHVTFDDGDDDWLDPNNAEDRFTFDGVPPKPPEAEAAGGSQPTRLAVAPKASKARKAPKPQESEQTPTRLALAPNPPKPPKPPKAEVQSQGNISAPIAVRCVNPESAMQEAHAPSSKRIRKAKFIQDASPAPPSPRKAKHAHFVGKRVEVWFHGEDGSGGFFPGTVDVHRARDDFIHVIYDDGDSFWINPASSREKIREVAPAAHASGKGQAKAQKQGPVPTNAPKAKVRPGVDKRRAPSHKTGRVPKGKGGLAKGAKDVGATERALGGAVPKAKEGHPLIGMELGVYYDDEKDVFKGVVTDYDPDKRMIHVYFHSDGQLDWIPTSESSIQWPECNAQGVPVNLILEDLHARAVMETPTRKRKQRKPQDVLGQVPEPKRTVKKKLAMKETLTPKTEDVALSQSPFFAGQIVWAKLHPSPFYPAEVCDADELCEANPVLAKERKKKQNEGKVMVCFFGNARKFGFIKPENVQDFSETYDAHKDFSSNDPVKVDEFQLAIGQAQLASEDLKGRVAKHGGKVSRVNAKIKKKRPFAEQSQPRGTKPKKVKGKQQPKGGEAAGGHNTRNDLPLGNDVNDFEIPLEEFEEGDIVWARSKGCPFWPAQVVDISLIPDAVKKLKKQKHICVIFFGPSATRTNDRDFGWVAKGSIVPFKAFFHKFESQRPGQGHKLASFTEAIREANTFMEAMDDQGPTQDGQWHAGGREDISLDDGQLRCKECKCVLQNGKSFKVRDWGGLCRQCKVGYEKGDFCKICERLYMPTEKDMACCDHCQCWIHGNCDPEARNVIQTQSVHPDAEVPYHCPICREAFPRKKSKKDSVAEMMLLKGSDPVVSKAKQLFAAKHLAKIRKKKHGPPMSVRHEAEAVNGAWDKLTDQEMADYIFQCSAVDAAKVADKGAKKTTTLVTLSTKQTKFNVVCKNVHGEFDIVNRKVLCKSECCHGKSIEERTFSAANFEEHAGAGSSRKWKDTIKVPSMNCRIRDVLEGMQGKSVEAPVKVSKDKKGRFVGPWNQVKDKAFKPIKVRWAKDHCAVCNLDVDYDVDQFVSCSACGITVHQSCYGIQELPSQDSVWLCRACEKQEAGKAKPQCCLCPIEGGALKETTLPGYWCHLACMQWIPEVTVLDMDRMEPIDRINHIHKERWDFKCSICGLKMGAIIQCQCCFTAYHPLCARLKGFQMETVEDPDGEFVEQISYCGRHSTKPPEGNGMLPYTSDALVKGVVRQEDPSAYLLHVNLPEFDIELKEGCARCEPLNRDGTWTREEKGSGRGISSLNAFWIPNIKPDVADSTVPIPKAKKASKPKSSRKSLEGGPWVPEVLEPLLPLPEGCPETINVSCNTKFGIFNVRTQNVTHEGMEMAASRFEAVSGKAQAKKWKSSLWVCDEECAPIMVIKLWLDEMGLSRNILGQLFQNVKNRNLFLEHKQLESDSSVTVRAVVNDICDRVLKAALCDAQAGMVGAAADHAEGVVEITERGGDGPGLGVTQLPGPPKEQPKGGKESNDKKVADAPHGNGIQNAGPGQCQENGKAEEEKGSVPADKKPACTCCNGASSDKTKEGQDGQALQSKSSELASAKAETQRKIQVAEKRAILLEKFYKLTVGCQLKLMRSGESAWHTVVVTGYKYFVASNRKIHLHKIQHLGGDVECLSLMNEKYEWVSTLPDPPQLGHKDADDGQAKSKSSVSLSECVGERLGVWWKDDAQYYYGQVIAYNPTDGRNEILYDDGLSEWLDLSKEVVDWGQEGLGKKSAKDGKEPGSVFVAIVCNGLKAFFHRNTRKVHLNDVRVPPEIFVEVAGLSGVEKWRSHIRILKGDASMGQTIGDWLVANRLEMRNKTSSGRKNWEAYHAKERMKIDKKIRKNKKALVSKPRNGKQAYVRGLPYTIGRRRRVNLHPSTFEEYTVEAFAERCKPKDDTKQGDPGATELSKEEEEYIGGFVKSMVQDVLLNVEQSVLKEEKALQAEAERSKEATPPPKEEDSGIDPAVEQMVASIFFTLSARNSKQALVPGNELVGKLIKLRRSKTMCKVLKVDMDERIITIENEGMPARQNFHDDFVAWHTLTPKLGRRQYRPSKTWRACKKDLCPNGFTYQCVGWRVSVYWDHDDNFYMATVDDYDPITGKHRILYDNGDCEWMTLWECTMRWVPKPTMVGKQKREIPSFVWVAINVLRGLFYVKQRQVQVPDPSTKKPKMVSVEEFEQMGREYNPNRKVLKARILNADGTASKQTIAQWLVSMGLGERKQAKKNASPDKAGRKGGKKGAKGTSLSLEELKATPMAVQLTEAMIKEKALYAFGKSFIHGWGLFAKEGIAEGDLVIEYRGDVVRHSVANEREIRYRQQKKDLYLFGVTESHVIDSTDDGSIARFMNHSCAPSTYSKIILIGDDPHLAFYARCNILPGQELTYDYRLKEEDDDNKIECKCGAPTCRGTIN